MLAAICACGSGNASASDRLAKRLDELEAELEKLNAHDSSGASTSAAARQEAGSVDDIAGIMSSLHVSSKPGVAASGMPASTPPAKRTSSSPLQTPAAAQPSSASAGQASAMSSHPVDVGSADEAEQAAPEPPAQLPIGAADRQVEQRVRLRQELKGYMVRPHALLPADMHLQAAKQLLILSQSPCLAQVALLSATQAIDMLPLVVKHAGARGHKHLWCCAGCYADNGQEQQHVQRDQS